MLHWGILSTGTIAKKFAGTVNQMRGQSVLTAVASRNAETASAFAKDYGIPHAYGSYEQLYSDPNVDVIYIATPNQLHSENIMQCIAHHKHVLCEKPLATDADTAARLFDAAAKEGVFLMEGMWIAHLPLLAKMRQLIDEGTIGQVRYLRADYGFIAQGARRTRKFRADLGGGALLDVGVYNLAFSRMVMGGDPVSVQSHASFTELGTDDLSVMQLWFSQGRAAVLTAAIGIAMPTEGVIYGDKGSIRFPNYQQAERMTVSVLGQQPYTVEMPFAYGGFEYQIRETERCLAHGELTSPAMPPEDTIAVLRLTDQARREWGMRFPFEKGISH